ncbi:MAG: TspO/MBR family protein [Anaerolineae bacterium]
MKALRFINILALVLLLVANSLASVTDVIGGQLTAEVSDNNPTLFTPAGYVFSIWSIIYIGLIAFAVYQARSSEGATRVRERIGPWFVINVILNVAWLFAWGYEVLWLSVIIMLALLASLIVIYERLQIGRVPEEAADAGKAATWSVRVPMSIYTGWISVATIANIAVLLASTGWEGGALGPRFWTVLVLLAGTVLGLLATFLRRDLAYALVVVWAFVGIAVARPEESLVAATAIVGALLVAIGVGAKITGWEPKPL